MTTHIDKLTLRFNGLTAAQGELAARLIAERLAQVCSRVDQPSLARSEHHVTLRPGESMGSLADRVARSIAASMGGVR